jgi:Holliday junction resolvase-like predicted endonuclease
MAIADANRKILHDYYQVMKAEDAHIRFIFLTGVSKFAQVSIFSGLNNLNDLTIDPRYSTICGYTQDELETNFPDHILALADANNLTKEECLAKIKYWYDGYSWDGKNFVYNPFSSLKLFDVKMFKDYWFSVSTPTFLIDILKRKNDITHITEIQEVSASGFDAYDIQKIDTKILLFQSGYLTIQNIFTNRFGNLMYRISLPNQEVRNAFTVHLLAEYVNKDTTETTSFQNKMLEDIFSGNCEILESNLKSLFANIPYELHIEKEAYYHSLLLLWLNLLGFKVEAEVSTNRGKIDAVWQWEDRIVVCEAKYSAKRVKINDLLNQAMKQIQDKKYYEKYLSGNNRVALLAVAFTGKNVACRMEEI